MKVQADSLELAAGATNETEGLRKLLAEAVLLLDNQSERLAILEDAAAIVGRDGTLYFDQRADFRAALKAALPAIREAAAGTEPPAVKESRERLN